MRHWTIAASLLLMLTALPGSAGEAIAPGEPSTSGSLQVRQDDGTLVDMPLEHTSVSIQVSAFVARATIEQTFSNPFDHPVEAVYTFPLGDRAAVDDFEMIVGERTIRGEIRRREEAREIYETARARGYRAALLEQERPNIFTQSVANIEPGSRIKVRIRTFETLPYEAGVYQLGFPLVVGPRYIPGGAAGLGSTATTRVAPTNAVPDADRVTPPVLRPGFRSGHDVEIRVALDAGVPIVDLSSPSHRVLVERQRGSRAVVRLAGDDRIPNKDFILRWNVSSRKPALGLLAHRTGIDGFFTLLVQPKGVVSAVEAAPKEIIFVLDTSGSMSGIPLEASKRFMRSALTTLGPRDTFNLIRFAGSAETFSAEPMFNEAGSVERALGWIENLRGRGGTEMLSGFRAAFDRPADPDRLRIVIFLTDGYIGNEQQILRAVGGVVGQARIYALGIGSSVNHFLLDRMARLGKGAYQFIRPDEQANRGVERFEGWVTKPYLTDLEIDWGALPVVDMVPQQPRDLFSGQTMTIVGRYLAPARGTVTVRGRLGGQYWEQQVEVELPAREERHAPLAALWARHRIEELMLSSPGVVTRSIRAEVTALALEYRLMSPFTSFVAVDDSQVVNPRGQVETIHQALPLPEGVSFAGVFGVDGPAALRAGEQAGDREDVLLPEDHGISSAAPMAEELEGLAEDVVVRASPRRLQRSEARAPARYEELERRRRSLEVQRQSAAPVRGPLVAGLQSPDAQESDEPLAVAEGAISGQAAGTVVFRDRYIQNLPVDKRLYQNVLSLIPGVQDASAGEPASERGAKSVGRRDIFQFHQTGRYRRQFGASARLLQAALRVLADLAEDGKLSSAEGKPSLAALLGAQTAKGAVAEDVFVHTVATWALLEASAALPQDPWVKETAAKAEGYLIGLAREDGWPTYSESEAVDAETTRWARLVLQRVGTTDAPEVSFPPGEASEPYTLLRGALAAARTGAPSGDLAGRIPFDRLVHAIPRGHLKMAG